VLIIKDGVECLTSTPSTSVCRRGKYERQKKFSRPVASRRILVGIR